MTSTPLHGWRPRHLSHSAIDKFVRCPYSYWSSYVKREPFTATRPMLIGSLFGKMIEDLHNGAIAPTMEDLGVSTILQTHYMNLRDDEQANLSDDDLVIVERLFDMYRTRDGGPYVGTPEFEFLVYLPDRQRVPYPIKGYFDLRCTDEPLIIEAKTSKWAEHPQWGWTEHRVNTSAQAAIYWHADKVLHGRDSEVRFLIMGYTDRGVSMRELSTHPGMDRVEDLQNEAAKLCVAIEEENFPCVCGRCRTGAA